MSASVFGWGMWVTRKGRVSAVCVFRGFVYIGWMLSAYVFSGCLWFGTRGQRVPTLRKAGARQLEIGFQAALSASERVARAQQGFADVAGEDGEGALAHGLGDGVGGGGNGCGDGGEGVAVATE